MASDLLTTSETARALGVTPARVRHMIAAGDLTATKFGRDWCIPSVEVERCRRRRRAGGRPWSPERAAQFLADVDAGREPFDALEANMARLRNRPAGGTLAGRWLDLTEAADCSADKVKALLVHRYTGPLPLIACHVGGDTSR